MARSRTHGFARGATLALLSVCAVACLSAGHARAAVPLSPSVTETQVPGGAAGALTTGPDGALWFTAGAGKIGRIGARGEAEVIALSQQTGYPQAIATGPEGNLWITTSAAVDRATPTGAVTEFPLPGKNERAGQIVAGPDGDLWFTLWVEAQKVNEVGEHAGPAYIVRISPGGEMTRFALPGDARERTRAPGGLTVGPEGDIWFTDPALGQIGRITPSGQIDEHSLDVAPDGIATGADGNLWFTAPGEIGRMTPAGEVREFSLRGGYAGSIVAGADGNLWFIAYGLSVGRITPSGQITQFSIKGGSEIADIAAGPQGAVWVSTTTDPIKYVNEGPIARIAPGQPGIEVATTAATSRHGRVALELACGGSRSVGCVGEVELKTGGSSSAAARYAVAPEGRGTVTVTLPQRARRQLADRRFLRIPYSIDSTGGVSGGGNVVVRTPRPLRRHPRPGEMLQIPLPVGYFDEAGLPGNYVTRGPDGALWLSGALGALTRLSPQGQLSRLAIPAVERFTGPITAGPDHSLWFLETNLFSYDATPTIGRMTPSGAYSEIALPKGPYAHGIAAGPDGDLWVARSSSEGEIDKVSPGGAVTRYRGLREPGAIVAGPGGLWFTDAGPSIGHITPAGKVTHFQIPGRGYLYDLTRGPDGNIWFGPWERRDRAPAIGKITPNGRLRAFTTRKRHRHGTLGALTAGPDGAVWFTESSPRPDRPDQHARQGQAVADAPRSRPDRHRQRRRQALVPRALELRGDGRRRRAAEDSLIMR
jgi:streptogramin lyase